MPSPTSDCLPIRKHLVTLSVIAFLTVSLVSLLFFFFVYAMLSCVLVLSKESACNAGDWGLIPGSRRSPGAGNGNPLQYSCLENSMDRGVWQATVLEIAKSSTQLFSVSVRY